MHIFYENLLSRAYFSSLYWELQIIENTFTLFPMERGSEIPPIQTRYHLLQIQQDLGLQCQSSIRHKFEVKSILAFIL